MTTTYTLAHKNALGEAHSFFSDLANGFISDVFDGFFRRADIVSLFDKLPVDFNRLACLFKQHVLISDIYTAPKATLDVLVQKALNSNRSPKGFRQKLSSLETSIAKEESKLAKALKTLAYVDIEDNEAITEQQVIITDIQSVLDGFYREEANLVGDFFKQRKKSPGKDEDEEQSDKEEELDEYTQVCRSRKQLEDIKGTIFGLEMACRKKMRGQPDGKTPSVATPVWSPVNLCPDEMARNLQGRPASELSEFADYVRSLENSPERGTPTGGDFPPSARADIPPSFASFLFATVRASPEKRPVPDTKITVAFLRKHKPYWFASNKKFRDPEVFKETFKVHPMIDTALMQRVHELKNKPTEEFQEVCSLLSVIYSRPQSLKGRPETGIVYESDSDDEDYETLITRRNEIVIKCVNDLLDV